MVNELEITPALTIAQVRKIGSPAISGLVRKTESGVAIKEDCHQFIKGMIIILNQFFTAAWNDFQVNQIAADFYSLYHYWTLADMKLFISKCRSMEYADQGKSLFGAWSPDKLMAWAKLYDDQWSACSATQAEHVHGLEKKQEERSADTTRENRTIAAAELHAKELEKFRKDHTK